ncbi:MAG: nitrilase-related carbon-nitrogen hydrolase [Armatimonadota bacterium]|nr:hypothetical protein [bacterium]
MKTGRWYYPLIALPLAAISGVLLALALPPNDISAIGWIAFIPLLIVSRITRPLIATGCAFIAALTCGRMLTGPVTTDAQLGNSIAAFGGLGLVLAFAVGVSAFGSRRMPAAVWAVFVACAGVSAEFLARSIFPVSLAISQYQTAGALRVASFTGIWGVTFLLWLFPASLVALCTSRRAWPVFTVSLLLTLLVVFLPFPKPSGTKTIQVAAIQAQDQWSASDITDKIASHTQIVVWPEYLLDHKSPVPVNAARHNRVYIVADIIEPTGGRKLYNAAILISPKGKRLAAFRKQHLFGKEQFEFTKGRSSRAVKCDKFTAGAPVCFDSEFTDVIRAQVRSGANIILIPNHDPETPNCTFNYLHLAAIPFRAAENGVPIAWAESNGLSSVIDSTGRILSRAPIHSATAARAHVHLRHRSTFFTLAGDYFAWICVATTFVLLTLSVLRKRTSG